MTFTLGMLNVLGTAYANDLPGCSNNVSPTIVAIDGEVILVSLRILDVGISCHRRLWLSYS